MLRPIVVCLLLATGVARAQDPSLLPDLVEGTAVEGVVEDGDPVVTSEAIKKGFTDATVVAVSYRFVPEASDTYTIDLRGFSFDAYLLLRDARGALVAEDDDGLVATHARIVAELTAGATYVVDAAALHGQRGGFELLARRGRPDPKESLDWTEREIQARIEAVFPPDKWKKVEVTKSKRYLVLTDGSAGRKFGKILDDDVFDGFRKLMDFEAPPMRRRLPVYLFNTRDGYVEFLQRVLGMSKEQAEKTGGLAYTDYYVTSYSSPHDPTHFHECAHQIMSNVLGLTGGGSWYQEGVAEYYEDKVKKFNRASETRMAIRTGQAAPLRELLGSASMLFEAGEDKRGGGGASGRYGQAASIILFLKEGPKKKSFDEFLQQMGRVPRGDVDAIEAVFRSIYGWSIEDLEAEWKDWFAG
ncbi:MAG: hypothetical protein H6825_07955 [Planctomycetes bacterium]|nr:hypothetical protein [Planctomycetota bacterium]